ncbi:MAG TPA: glycosyltransferase family 4 protein [Opitutus sp.]|nr:glycosyltransferase family 4 protein [Opitutus sp.]
MAESWLVIGHQATNSGAPRMLLEVLRGVRAECGPAWRCKILLRRGGPLVEEFARIGEVRVLMHPRAELPGLGAALFRKFVDRPRNEPRRFARAMEDWRGERFDLIYSNTATNGRLLGALRPLDCPVVTHVHELEYSLKRFVSAATLATTLERSDEFIAVSTAVGGDLEKRGVRRERVTVVSNFLAQLPGAGEVGPLRAELCGRLGLSRETRLITGCGHIDWLKGPDLFVEFAEKVIGRTCVPVAFLWIGGDTDRRFAAGVRRAVQRRGLQHAVRFLGPDPDPGRIFGASDIVAVTSRVESFSLVALEAAARGRPVLGFAAARGLQEVLANEKGLIAVGLDVGAMATAAARLLADPEEASRVGGRLRERVAAEFLARRRIPEILSVTDRRRARRRDHD